MGLPYVVLVDHRVLERRVDALMAKKLLHLFDRHPLINGHRCQRPAELVRMNLVEVQFLANLAETNFHTADLQPLIRTEEGYEQRFIVIRPLRKILLQVNLRPRIEVYLPFFVALAENDAFPTVKIDIVPVQLHKLADADSGRSQNVNHREITRAVTVIAHELQRFIRVGLLDGFPRLHLVNPPYRTFHDVILIFQPGEEGGKHPADIVQRHLADRTALLVGIQVA